MRLLLAAHADPNAKASSPVPGITPLMLAAAHGRTGCVHALLEGGANVSARCTDEVQATALHVAAQEGQEVSCHNAAVLYNCIMHQRATTAGCASGSADR